MTDTFFPQYHLGRAILATLSIGLVVLFLNVVIEVRHRRKD